MYIHRLIIFLLILWCACKVSSNCSRKEEQEETIRRLNGQEQKIDDNNWLDDLTYDDDFVKKEDVNDKRDNLEKQKPKKSL